MKLRAVPTSLAELLVLASGAAPLPLADTMVALLLARALMAATQLGVFEALEDGPLTPAEVALRCGLHEVASDRLLFALAGAGYLRERRGCYALARVARRWMLRSSAQSLHDATLHRYLDLSFLNHAEDYARTGIPLDYHAALTPAEWTIYERGQRSHAAFTAREVAARTPAPRHPTVMLDVGGGHGLFSAALCRRHPGLRATVLDLPDAERACVEAIAREPAGDRISFRAGDARVDDLGVDAFDLVLVANLAHHFDSQLNHALMRRAGAALRPGGWVAILDVERASTPARAGQIGGLAGFYFGMTSAGGAWSAADMAVWQRAAGLRPRRPIRLLTGPGYVIQAARKR